MSEAMWRIKEWGDYTPESYAMTEHGTRRFETTSFQDALAYYFDRMREWADESDAEYDSDDRATVDSIIADAKCEPSADTTGGLHYWIRAGSGETVHFQLLKKSL